MKVHLIIVNDCDEFESTGDHIYKVYLNKRKANKVAEIIRKYQDSCPAYPYGEDDDEYDKSLEKWRRCNPLRKIFPFAEAGISVTVRTVNVEE